MKKHVFIFGIITLLGVGICACAPAATGPIQLGPDDNGTTVDLSVGDSFSILLEGNPTTGYTWENDPLPDTSVLELTEEPTFKSNSKALGAGGEFIFTYRATGEGETSLRLIYHRPFEQDVPPQEIYEVTVHITQ